MSSKWEQCRRSHSEIFPLFIWIIPQLGLPGNCLLDVTSPDAIQCLHVSLPSFRTDFLQPCNMSGLFKTFSNRSKMEICRLISIGVVMFTDLRFVIVTYLIQSVCSALTSDFFRGKCEESWRNFMRKRTQFDNFPFTSSHLFFSLC